MRAAYEQEVDPNPPLSHSAAAYNTVLTGVEGILNMPREQWASRVSRPQIVAALTSYTQRGGSLPTGMRGETLQERAAYLEDLRYLQGTVRDIIASAPEDWDEFLGHMRENLGARPTSQNYPAHIHLVQFLLGPVCGLSQAEVLRHGSPFSHQSWENPKNASSRICIVINAIRTAW